MTTTKTPPHPCLGYGHCQACIAHHKPTCCECGDVFVPWHPDIQHLYVSGQMT